MHRHAAWYIVLPFPMRISLRPACILLIIAAVAVVAGSESTPGSARSELQLELGDLLYGDERYWEALQAYTLAKQGARPEQMLRAAAGSLRSALTVAEFTRAYQEAVFLGEQGVADPALRTLRADAFWSAGLFDEAEAMYSDILSDDAAHPAARHGLARSLAASSRAEDALVEIQAAIATGSRPEFHHTLGAVYQQLGRYPEAAAALEHYAETLPNVSESRRTEWARSRARLLRSFGEARPLEIVNDPDGQHVIPFDLVQDKIVVQGRVNGGPVIDIVVDTGAEQMVLSQQTAERMGVESVASTISAGVGDVGVRGLEVGRVESVEIGSLLVRNLPTIIKNPPLTDLPLQRVRDSISPVAMRLSADIDYGARRMTLARSLPESPADIELPMRVNRLAVVRGVVNGEHERSFVVDTGGEVISLSIATAASLGMTPPRYIPLQVYGTSGWDSDAFLLPGVRLAFDEIRYDNYAVVVLNLHRPSALLGFHIGGIIGHRFLSDYRVVMDMERAVLRLTTQKS